MKKLLILLALLIPIFFTVSSFKWGLPSKKVDAKHGDTFNLSKYKGKIVVLNFWASWSKASRAEHKNLMRVYQVYRLNPKVVFASVSLDTDEAAWKAAIEEDGLLWKDQFCDFKKYESPMAIKYGVTSLPKVLVFDGTGKQVSTAVNTHDLDITISGLLK